jgi:hypothetical protein
MRNVAGLIKDSSIELEKISSLFFLSLKADMVYFDASLIAAGASNRKPATVGVKGETHWSTIRPPAVARSISVCTCASITMSAYSSKEYIHTKQLKIALYL